MSSDSARAGCVSFIWIATFFANELGHTDLCWSGRTGGTSSLPIEDLEFPEVGRASPSGLSTVHECIQCQVQFQDIDARLAKHSPFAAARVLPD